MSAEQEKVIIDAGGLYLSPGFIDIHTPGGQDGTYFSETDRRAAVSGSQNDEPDTKFVKFY